MGEFREGGRSKSKEVNYSTQQRRHVNRGRILCAVAALREKNRPATSKSYFIMY
jgi:hypothetical protein